MTPLERAEDEAQAAVMNGNGLRELMEAIQHPEGTTDDSPSVAWTLHAADKTTMILSWGWHMDGGAYVTVQKFDRVTGEPLPISSASSTSPWSPSKETWLGRHRHKVLVR